jgi:hypothetical protein
MLPATIDEHSYQVKRAAKERDSLDIGELRLQQWGK